ncbi:MAG TPA: hypothetical protein VK524_33935, partial [Polyangiaceae bacterium]|nr:hypothetical protein [Polyangiaceae bacterium]
MTFRRLLLCAVSLSGVLLGRSAPAQTQEPQFALNRFEPSERGSDWFAAESLDLRGDKRPAFGVILDYARNPLVLYDRSGEAVTSLVSDQLFLHVGGSLVLYDRLRFGLNVPVGVLLRGEGGALDSSVVTTEEGPGLGDLRASADLRLFGAYRKPATLALGVRALVPTGSQEAYAGDGSVRVGPRLMLAGEIDAFAYAAQVGYMHRSNDTAFAGAPRGGELNFVAAAGFRIMDGDLLLGPELFGSTGVSDSDAVFGRSSTALELILGGHGKLSRTVQMGIGIGPGLTRGLGVPEVRGLVSLQWTSAVKVPKPGDRDRDGVLDPHDACPGQFGTPTSDPETNGCWSEFGAEVPGSNDCGKQRGVMSEDPSLRDCPDADGDRITDVRDACPEEPGPASDDPKGNGCPASDGDGDGILDGEDACPNAAGTQSEDPKKRGCPVAHVESGQIRIREQLQFAYNSARILDASDTVLEAVLKILK